MTDDGPVIDGRDPEAIARDVRSRVPYYTREWDADAGDAGTALLEVFSRIAADVVERLDQVPEKHRVAFLDRLGFERRPPQPARLPVVFQVSDGATENVAIPGGTEAVAEVAGTEQVFEVPPDGGFELTPSLLQRVYSVVPRTDQLFEHWSSLRAGVSPGVTVFDGSDVQGHAFYVGGGDLLDLQPDSTVRLSLRSNVPGTHLRDCLEWEYYGEEERNGESIVKWHPLDVHGRGRDPSCDWSEREQVEQFLREIEEDADEDLEGFGFRPVDDLPRWVRYRLVASIAADVRERFGRGQRTTEGRGRDRTLPENLLPSVSDDEREELEALLEDRLRDLGSELHRIADRASSRRRAGITESVELELEIPGVTTEFSVAGRESRWLRCRIPRDDFGQGLFDVEIEGIQLSVGRGTNGGEASEGLVPDGVFSNGVPLSVADGGEFLPFGDEPQRLDAFYVASREAFTNPGTDVELWFSSGGTRNVGDGAPEVSWEYWNGSGWTLIGALYDGTVALTEPGRVVFPVPRDLEPTTVGGQDGHWIRVRLVGGVYGRVAYEEVEEGSWERVGVDPPRFDDLRIRYERDATPEHVLSYNNREFSADLTDRGRGRFRPFRSLPDATQTLYLGFDGPLSDGPIQLLFSLLERSYPDGFYPRLQWEYRTADGPEGWEPLVVSDGTEGLTGHGVVGFVFPDESSETRVFGERRHWIRARVTGDPFALTATTAFVRDEDGATTTLEEGLEPFQETVETYPPTGDQLPTPPVLAGLYPNAGWVYNTRTIAGEVLGSSDGTPDQSFGVITPPATHAEVWVDELLVLSEGRRRRLTEERPERVEAVTGPDGEPSRFWVRWDAVPDFLDSGPDDRHYTLDGAAGLVSFGDGTRGRIPPRGRGNVRASYRTGGGSDGNVPVGALTGLKSSIPLVDGVTNPEPGDGGADSESMAETLQRAPRQLRDRNRAVTDVDFERVAAAASREIKRVRCLRMDRAGEFDPGWVTLLVVPTTVRPIPIPSTELRERVRESLRERAPATLLDSRRLVVRGPSYVAVSVRATLQAGAGVGSVSSLEEDVVESLAEFLHPLSGGPAGEGWAFGELPYLSDLYALLEGVDGVDHVEELVVGFRGTGEPVVVTEGDPLPMVAPDVLVRSGIHDIRATGGV